jgi:hypothetical protein
MGQYFLPVIFSDNNGKAVIKLVLYPDGAKIDEHYYLDNGLLEITELYLSPDSPFYMSNLVWAGDYAENEKNSDKNLHNIAQEFENKPYVKLITSSNKKLSFIVNHSKKIYIDKSTIKNNIHPLPILTADNCYEYDRTDRELVGSWCRDIISMEHERPSEPYNEVIVNFTTYDEEYNKKK